jgi:hypothetical protein
MIDDSELASLPVIRGLETRCSPVYVPPEIRFRRNILHLDGQGGTMNDLRGLIPLKTQHDCTSYQGLESLSLLVLPHGAERRPSRPSAFPTIETAIPST